MPALHCGFGARGTFRPQRSGPVGLTKPTTFLRLRAPSHERACIEQSLLVFMRLTLKAPLKLQLLIKVSELLIGLLLMAGKTQVFWEKKFFLGFKAF